MMKEEIIRYHNGQDYKIEYAGELSNEQKIQAVADYLEKHEQKIIDRPNIYIPSSLNQKYLDRMTNERKNMTNIPFSILYSIITYLEFIRHSLMFINNISFYWLDREIVRCDDKGIRSFGYLLKKGCKDHLDELYKMSIPSEFNISEIQFEKIFKNRIMFGEYIENNGSSVNNVDISKYRDEFIKTQIKFVEMTNIRSYEYGYKLNFNELLFNEDELRSEYEYQGGIIKMHNGDIINITGSTGINIVNKSLFSEAINNIRETRSNEIAIAIQDLAKLIESTNLKDKEETLENIESLAEEAAKPNPKKGTLRTLGNSILNAVQKVSDIAERAIPLINIISKLWL